MSSGLCYAPVMRRLFLGVLAVGALACTETAELEVTHFKRPCYTFDQSMCAVYREGPNEPWYDLEGYIGGFTPEWQTEYVVEVEVEYSSSYYTWGDLRYFSLSEVKSQRDVAPGTTFELDLSPDHLVATSSMSFELGQDRNVVCADAETCERARDILRGGGWFPATLEHPATKHDPLVLLKLNR